MFTDTQLQEFIAGKIAGNRFPYISGQEQVIEAYIKRLYHRICRIPGVKCDAEWNHFGSGYASFIEFFCYKNEDLIVEKEAFGRKQIRTNGIIIDVSRLAPVAIIGEDERYQTIRTDTNEVVAGSYSSLPGMSKFSISSKHIVLAQRLKQALAEFEFILLEEETVLKPLPFKAEIATIYREPSEYRVLDAIFYWED